MKGALAFVAIMAVAYVAMIGLIFYGVANWGPW